MADYQEFFIPSTQEGFKLQTLLWETESPKGVVQLVHGMVEHIERYDDFAKWLNTKGYAVVGHCHLGHGKSINTDKDLGYFGAKDGWKHVVDDVDAVRKFAQEKYPELPYFILGHSMGSFVLRTYIANPEYAKGLAGVIISGTANQPAGLVKAGGAVAGLISAFCGKRHPSKLLNNMAFGAYNDRIENKRNEFDWLSWNEANVDAYSADPLCGYLFTAKAFGDMFGGLAFLADGKSADTIEKKLPVLFIAGEDDPCGAYGEGPKQLCEQYGKTGIERVELKLYTHMRHEVLNETNKEIVYNDVLAFLESAI